MVTFPQILRKLQRGVLSQLVKRKLMSEEAHVDTAEDRLRALFSSRIEI